MRLVKLVDTNDGAMYINPECVAVVYTTIFGNTIIGMTNGENAFPKESANEVAAIIRGGGNDD